MENKLELYTVAGVATAPNFMEEFRLELELRFQENGWEVHSESLFPYGDWSLAIVSQMKELSHDLIPGFSRSTRWIAGRRLAASIKASYQGGTVLIIGHSGGGVAGIHAAQLLAAEIHIPCIRIVQIGSPRCAIPPDLRDAVMYVRSVNRQGKISDPVTRLGSWGGWVRGRFSIPRWNTDMLPPGVITDLPIQGGHKEYFRNSSRFRSEEGKSNMLLLENAIWAWFHKFM